MEKLSGHGYTIDNVLSKDKIEEAQQGLAKGDHSGTSDIIRGAMFTSGYGALLEADGELANEWLGVPKVELDEVVKEALEKYA